MKRKDVILVRINYDLVRKILISVADADMHQDISNYNICIGEDTDVVGWHIGKLIEAGYLKGINSSSKTEPYDYISVELTYSGEQFLNKIENNQLWAKIKKYLGDNSVSITFKAIELTYNILR